VLHDGRPAENPLSLSKQIAFLGWEGRLLTSRFQANYISAQG
jgi:hypothetical protein